MTDRDPSEPLSQAQDPSPLTIWTASIRLRKRERVRVIPDRSPGVARGVAGTPFVPETSCGGSTPAANASNSVNERHSAAGAPDCPGASAPGFFMSPYLDAAELDCQIGARIRAMRVLAGLRLVDLAAHLGISQQQLMKYELGRNRVSASRLWQIAEVLDADIRFFFRRS